VILRIATAAVSFCTLSGSASTVGRHASPKTAFSSFSARSIS